VLEKNLICMNMDEFSAARVVTFLNPYSFLKILESDVQLSKFDKVCIDGIALKIFLSLVYRDKNIERLSFDFTSVANEVFEKAASQREKGFILGSDLRSNDGFLTKIARMFPGIELEGRSGYFDNDDGMSDFVSSFSATDYELVDAGFKGRIYTCGGFIHQTAMGGDGLYYPGWVDRWNLRFAYRMLKEPTTVRRYLIDYPKAFILLARNIEKFKY